MEQVTVSQNAALTLLGGFSISVNGRVLTDDINRSLKLWNVLSYLLVNRNRAVPQSEFIRVFWPGDNSANPVNALKTLLYRIRTMLEPLFDRGIEPILSQRGSYMWNSAVVCHSDADRFELLCQQIQTATLSPTQQLTLCREAYQLYRGDFLPKLSGEAWVIPLSAHYHGLYLELVKTMAGLLEDQGAFEEMAQVAGRASALAPLDKDLHALIVRAMLHQGKDDAALSHYESATELLYRTLDVRPSEEMQELYGEIMSVTKAVETDLDVIQGELQEAARRPGAFMCEYGFFREIYRLEARRAQRTGLSIHLGLLTFRLSDGSMPPLKLLADTMDQLGAILTENLRQGDVVAKYSGAQYVVMLPAANFEDSSMVMERVVSAFGRQHRRSTLKLTYNIRALEQGT